MNFNPLPGARDVMGVDLSIAEYERERRLFHP